MRVCASCQVQYLKETISIARAVALYHVDEDTLRAACLVMSDGLMFEADVRAVADRVLVPNTTLLLLIGIALKETKIAMKKIEALRDEIEKSYLKVFRIQRLNEEAALIKRSIQSVQIVGHNLWLAALGRRCLEAMSSDDILE